jgi:hypothetical protein
MEIPFISESFDLNSAIFLKFHETAKDFPEIVIEEKDFSHTVYR